MKYTSLDHFFTILGNKQRVKILQLLNNEGPKRVSDIVKALKGEQSSISHSLKQLLLCNFVTVQSEGKERIYAINEDTVKPLLELVEYHVEKYCIKSKPS